MKIYDGNYTCAKCNTDYLWKYVDYTEDRGRIGYVTPAVWYPPKTSKGTLLVQAERKYVLTYCPYCNFENRIDYNDYIQEQ